MSDDSKYTTAEGAAAMQEEGLTLDDSAPSLLGRIADRLFDSIADVRAALDAGDLYKARLALGRLERLRVALDAYVKGVAGKDIAEGKPKPE